MKKQNTANLFKMGLLATAVATIVGCSAGTSTYDAAAKNTIIISDPAVNCDTVTVGGTPAQRVADGRYQVLANASGIVQAMGCVDTVSLAQIGDMASDGDFADEGTNEVVTPVTTLIQEFVKTGKTPAQARTIASQVLGVPENLLNVQPQRDVRLQKAAAKIVAVVQVVKAGGGNAGAALTKVAEKLATTGSDTLENSLKDSTFMDDVITSAAVPADKKEVVKATVEKTTTTIASATTVAQAVAVNKIVNDSVAAKITNGTATVENIATSVQAELNAFANVAAEIEDRVKPVDGGVNDSDIDLSGASGGSTF